MKNNNKIRVVAFLFLLSSLSGFAQNNGKSSVPKNYSLTPKLPKPPKPEPFEVTTIPLPQEVSEAVLANYLPDGEHLILDVTMKGKHESDLAVIKEDGSGFMLGFIPAKWVRAS